MERTAAPSVSPSPPPAVGAGVGTPVHVAVTPSARTGSAPLRSLELESNVGSNRSF